MLAAAQAVEHYEITHCGALNRWALALDLNDAAALLDGTLQEEAQTDQNLTDIADAAVNAEALSRTDQFRNGPVRLEGAGSFSASNTSPSPHRGQTSALCGETGITLHRRSPAHKIVVEPLGNAWTVFVDETEPVTFAPGGKAEDATKRVAFSVALKNQEVELHIRLRNGQPGARFVCFPPLSSEEPPLLVGGAAFNHHHAEAGHAPA